ncbi:MAG TPA: MarR family transcriptional regulator [Jatrophihabitans sp.]|nr:MarR family transcriptional regulator [Jatrophihabitans sp.]
MSQRMPVDRPTNDQVDAVLAASRVLVAVSAASIAAIDETVTLPQLRALTAVASRGTMNSATLAEALGVHASSATRICDRLVSAGLLGRRDDPADRRHLQLYLTEAGRQLVEAVTRRRRDSIARILSNVPAADREAMAATFERFAAAGGEPRPNDLWTMGWQAK